MNFKELKTCLCCKSSNLKQVIDLGYQPLANSFHDGNTELLRFPLQLNFCIECTHLQLSISVDPKLMFKDYKYVSGTTTTLKEYSRWFAGFVREYYEKDGNSILDIGCNDGSQLNMFKKTGWDTFGIDPAENLISLAATNHFVRCGFIESTDIDRKFDAIIAQNVFAHNANPNAFLWKCASLLNSDGKIFIQVSQADMIVNNEFDTIYHEHISFFNIKSFNELLRHCRLHLVDVVKTPIHGGSYIFIVAKQYPKNQFKIKNLLVNEELKGLHKFETYEKYANKIGCIKEELQHLKRVSINHKFIGYGAAAKGMTALNYFNLPITIDYIIDDNPLKQNLYTPGTNIPIYSIDKLKELNESAEVTFIPLAWNFFDEIKNRIKEVRNNPDDMFLKYFPEVKWSK